MAQSFQAVSVSLGEAERIKNGKKWTKKEFQTHQQSGYQVDPKYTHLNTIIKSVHGQSERQVVNQFFATTMLKLNQKKQAQVTMWNQNHRGKTNPKTGKKYHMKSVDNRQMFPVGKYANRGKRKLPYDILKSHIEQGNARGKEPQASRYRMNVLQQYIVGFGNHNEWKNDQTRKQILAWIHGNNPSNAKVGKDAFETHYIKPYLEQFEKQNPSLHIVQAVVQYDEPDPHLHLTVLPHWDAPTRNGLGSVSYTGCLIHDHPELAKDKQTTIDRFYQTQHAKIKNLIQHAKPLDGIFYTKNPQNKPFQGYQMKLNPPMPRTNQKPIRVNLFAKMEQDKAKQLAWVKEQKNKLQQRDDQDKQNAIETIKDLEPTHKVPQTKLNDREIPEEICTDAGEKQHLKQSTSWLRNIAMDLLKKAKQEALKIKALLQKRFKDNEQKEKQLNKIKTALDQQQQQQNERAKKIKQTEQNLKQREHSLKKQQQTFNRSTLATRILLKQSFMSLDPQLSEQQAEAYASGRKMFHGKSTFALLVDRTKMALQSNDPKRKENAQQINDKLNQLLKKEITNQQTLEIDTNKEEEQEEPEP